MPAQLKRRRAPARPQPGTIRPARPGDSADIARLIRALAAYEKLSGQCRATGPAVRRTLFGRRARARALVAESGGRIVGAAVVFPTFSTFLCKQGLFLEDLFVEPEHRGRGLGKALLQRVIDLAREQRCARVEWRVLDWNKPSIEFYRRAFGAQIMREWLSCRVTLEK